MPVLLTKCLSIKVTDEDYASFEAAAGDRRVSAWARDVLLQAATTQPTEMILLVELLALRTIVVNLQFALAHGEPPTVEAMQRLIERADREKFGRAQERLHAHHLQAPERRAGAHVSRGRVQQRPRQLLHDGRSDRRSVARPARRAVGTRGRGRRGALPAARGRPAPADRRAARPPSDGLPVHERARRTRQDDGAPRRVGRDVLGAEERLADGARGRRRTGPGGPSSERGRGPGRGGAVRPGAARAAIFRPKPPAAGSPRGSSTTARGRWPATPRRSSTRTSSSSISRTPRAARSVRCSRGSSIGRSSTGPRSIAPSWPSRLAGLGYEIERGASGQPEIRRLHAGVPGGLEPRRQQIQAHLEQHQRHGAGAAQIAAHQTREAKLDRTHDEVQRAHQEMADAFGDQPARVVREAQERAPSCARIRRPASRRTRP